MNRGEILKLALQHTSNPVDAFSLAKAMIEFLEEGEKKTSPSILPKPLKSSSSKLEEGKARAKQWRAKMKKKVGHPSRNRLPWTEEDLTILMKAMRDKKPIINTARELKRTYGAVYYVSKLILSGVHSELWAEIQKNG